MSYINNYKPDSNVLDKVTIVITRYYDSNYIVGLLKYFKLYNIPARILILDTGPTPIDTEEYTELFDDSKVTYLKYSNKLHPYKKFVKGLKNVSTPYSVICPEDDFIVPRSIQECVYFLEQNPEYSVAHGLYCYHYLRENKKGGIEFIWTHNPLMTTSITHNRPSERLKYQLSHYYPAFSAVHRTDLMQLIWKETVKYTSDARFGEILSSALGLIYGKMILLPIFYASRETRPNSAGTILDPWHVLVQRDDFQVKCEKVVNCLAEHLCKQEPLSVEASAKIARESLDAYLKNIQKYKKRRCGKTYNLLKNAMEKCYLKGSIVTALNLRRSYLNLRYFHLWKVKKEYSRLLEKEDSRFYSDFSRIKDIVIRSRINIQNNYDCILDPPKKSGDTNDSS